MQRYSNMSNYTVIRSNDHLAHYGVLGMKWGVRKQRPSSGLTRRKASYHVTSKSSKKTKNSSSNNKENRRRKVAIGIAAVGGAILAAYGGYKIYGARVASNKRYNKKVAEKILETSGNNVVSKLDAALEANKHNYPLETKQMLWASVYNAQDTHNRNKKLAEDILKRKSRVRNIIPSVATDYYKPFKTF